MKCGACCRQEELIVTVTADDIVQIMDGLSLTPEEALRFLDFYVLSEGEPIPPGLKHIPSIATESGMAYPALRKIDGGDCIFLLDTQCMIHLIRPVVCRSFPFIFKRDQENLSWGFNAMKTICPGIGGGDGVSIKELQNLGSYILGSMERNAEFVKDWNESSESTARKFVERIDERFR